MCQSLPVILCILPISTKWSILTQQPVQIGASTRQADRCSPQFHLRTLPAIVTYLAAISMAFIFGGASVLLFVLWWATAKRRGKPALTVARPESVDLSDDSEVDIDGASGTLPSVPAPSQLLV